MSLVGTNMVLGSNEHADYVRSQGILPPGMSYVEWYNAGMPQTSLQAQGLQMYTGPQANATYAFPNAGTISTTGPAVPAGGLGGAVQAGLGGLIAQGFNALGQRLFGGGAAAPSTTAALPALPGGLGGAIGGTIAGAGIDVLKGALAPAGGGCGCHGSNGRDACTGQRTTSQRAPQATLFGGCCPPGRVLRRQPWARDICIKKPRMNPFNPAALARADRRVTTFARRAAPMLKDLGYAVTSWRKVSLGKKRKKRR